MPAIKLQWKTGAGAHSYQVWRGTTADSGAASVLAATVVGNTYLDESAVEGTAYYYWLKAVSTAGVSGFSPAVGPLTAGRTLAPPADLEASLVAEGEVALVWAAVAGATKYDVWRHSAEDFSAATKVGSNVAATDYDDTPPTLDALRFYWVVAKDDAGHESLPSLAAVGVALLPVPASPTGVGATDGVAYKITITWTAAAHATGYEIWRHTSNASGSATKIATVGAVTSYDHFPGSATSFYFWVKATNYRGTSAFSAPDTGHAYIPPPPPPAAPENCVATNDQEGQVTITADTVAAASSYNVYRNTTLTPGTATLIASGLASPSHVDTTMALETAYYYWVSATGAGGEGDKSNADDGFALTPSTPPAAPTGVNATDGLNAKTTVTWSASATATSYSVWRDGTQIASGLTALTYDDETGVSGQVYDYTVKATNAAGTSAASSANSGFRYASVCGLSLSGSGTGHDREYYRDGFATLHISFSASGIKDRLKVWFDLTLVYDSGCVAGTHTADITNGGASGGVRIEVIADCEGVGSSAWTADFTCS